jgi:hypothetical protein
MGLYPTCLPLLLVGQIDRNVTPEQLQQLQHLQHLQHLQQFRITKER